MVLVRSKRMERRGNNTGGASLPPHCQGRFLGLAVITQPMTWRRDASLHHTRTSSYTLDFINKIALRWSFVVVFALKS